MAVGLQRTGVPRRHLGGRHSTRRSSHRKSRDEGCPSNREGEEMERMSNQCQYCLLFLSRAKSRGPECDEVSLVDQGAMSCVTALNERADPKK